MADMREVTDRIYKQHCCKCHSRHKLNCEYEQCSKEQYDQWVEETVQQIKDEMAPSGEI